MKNLLALAAVASLFVASPATAGTISVKPPVAGNGIYSLYLNSGADVIDTVEVLVTPNAGSAFANNNSGNGPSGPRVPGEAFTYLNRRLNADPLDDPANKGWSILGLVNTSVLFGFTGGPLGSTITTAQDPNGELFLSNVLMNPVAGGGTANVKTYRLGVVIDDDTVAFPIAIPEPAALAMAGLGMLGMVAASRRKS
ncbi:MAG: PEP-CTERM sorting domain-containing protein [Pirellulales bacterium]|nr:PEP-CTERM sorting domain-containing protein [Pirellulales bacterium]